MLYLFMEVVIVELLFSVKPKEIAMISFLKPNYLLRPNHFMETFHNNRELLPSRDSRVVNLSVWLLLM